MKKAVRKKAGCKACNFIKKSLQHKFFPVNIAKFEEHVRTAASDVTLGSDCLGLPFGTVAFKTILTQ